MFSKVNDLNSYHDSNRMSMKDNHLNILSVDITDKCNFKCRHCFNVSGSRPQELKELDDDELLALSSDIIKQSPSTVCICGGEPLMRSEIMFNLIKTLKDGHVRNVNTVSNGYLIDKHVAKEFYDSGVNVVQISVDGNSPDTHDWLRRCPGSFERAISAIQNLVDEGVDVGVACTPTSMNIKEVPKLIERLDSLGVISFRMQPIMNLGRAESIIDYFPSKEQYLWLSHKLNTLSVNNVFNLSLEWGDPMEHIYAMAHGYNIRSLSISAYGDLMISPYIPISFGNIRNNSLSAYIDHNVLKSFTSQGIKDLLLKMSESGNLDVNSIVKDFPKLYYSPNIDYDIMSSDFEEKCKTLKERIQ